MRGDAASATMALHSQGSPTDVLGVNIAAPEEYAPSILVPIPRAKGRGLLGLAEGNLLPFAGDDVWNCYELSWLNASGVPRRQTLELTIPCTTPFIVESKSLKLYLTSFRNHGAFHEDCTVAIGKRLRDLLEPRYLRIGGFWYPRGGIPIDVFWQTGELPKNAWLPEPGVPPYRGR